MPESKAGQREGPREGNANEEKIATIRKGFGPKAWYAKKIGEPERRRLSIAPGGWGQGK